MNAVSQICYIFFCFVVMLFMASIFFSSGFRDTQCHCSSRPVETLLLLFSDTKVGLNCSCDQCYQ